MESKAVKYDDKKVFAYLADLFYYKVILKQHKGNFLKKTVFISQKKMKTIIFIMIFSKST